MVDHIESDSNALIWEREVPDARGPMRAPAPAEIMAAAFEIADREGLHAVSVKRVASKLRVPATRIDNYLTSREDLLDLMLDAAFAEIDPPEQEGAGWRAQLELIARATQVTAQRHPWLRSLAGTRTPCGPNGLRNSERALAALDGVGFDAATMTQAVNTVLAYVYGFVQLELVEPGRKMDEEHDLQRRTRTAQYLMARVGTGDYPTLARVFADASNLTTANGFETGLAYVLDGIAASLAADAAGLVQVAGAGQAEGAALAYGAAQAEGGVQAEGGGGHGDTAVTSVDEQPQPLTAPGSAAAAARGRLGRRR